MICDAILKWLAPVLSFTSEEAWRLYRPDSEPSVHLTLFPEGLEKFRDDALAMKWEIIRTIRGVVTGALEVERAAKNIGSSLEASPIIYLPEMYISHLFDVDWAEVCITSNAEVVVLKHGEDAPPDAFQLEHAPGIGVVVEKAVGTKCARSWKILPTVGEDAEYPDVSPRDAKALREWKALGVTV
jgi:isoleucyl-tRNA synthetase